MALPQPTWYELFAEILQWSTRRSTDAAKQMTTMLLDQFSLKAAVLYCASPVDHTLVLRAQTGFTDGDIPTAVLQDATAEQSTLTDNLIRIIYDLPQSEQCRKCPNRALIGEYHLPAAVLVPLTLTETFFDFARPTRAMGVLCLYPAIAEDAQPLGQWMEMLRYSLSVAYCNSVERDKLEIRENIVDRAINSPDINSFLYRVLSILRDDWAFEASSVFVEDEQNGFLRLHATTGLIGRPQKKDVFYMPDEKQQKTVQCFQEMTEIILSDPDTAWQSGRFNEETALPKRAAGWFPIRHPPSTTAPTPKMLGVMRVVNKKSRLAHNVTSVSFSWEDVYLLRFVAEIIGIIAFLFERATNRSENFQRVTHGIRNYLGSAAKNLNQLHERAGLEGIMNPPFRHNIPNALASLEAIDWQIEKYAAWDEALEVDIVEVKLYKEVLTKVVEAASKVARSMNITTLDITRLSDAGFSSMPIVAGNVKALILVFKNLIENSLKYSKTVASCRIELEYASCDRKLQVRVKDYGIGIPDAQRHWIFAEGFRGDNAMARNPVGTGLGLAQSKAFMMAMGGDLRLEKTSEPTTFVVELNEWEAHQ